MEIKYLNDGRIVVKGLDPRDMMYKNFRGEVTKTNANGQRKFDLRLNDLDDARIFANDLGVIVKPVLPKDIRDARSDKEKRQWSAMDFEEKVAFCEANGIVPNYYTTKVIVSFKTYALGNKDKPGPKVVWKDGNRSGEYDENTIGQLDFDDILSVPMMILKARPYNWNNSSGVSLKLYSLAVELDTQYDVGSYFDTLDEEEIL